MAIDAASVANVSLIFRTEHIELRPLNSSVHSSQGNFELLSALFLVKAMLLLGTASLLA